MSVSRAFQLRARVAGGKKRATCFPVLCSTAGLGAKEVRRQGSGGGGRKKVASGVHVLPPLMAHDS
jgi:hypothetical protein